MIESIAQNVSTESELLKSALSILETKKFTFELTGDSTKQEEACKNARQQIENKRQEIENAIKQIEAFALENSESVPNFKHNKELENAYYELHGRLTHLEFVLDEVERVEQQKVKMQAHDAV